MKFLITGATGFVGSHTVYELLELGHEVHIITRSREKAKEKLGDRVTIIEWENFNSELSFPTDSYDVLVNLMGANIAEKKWTNERKKVLYNSRVDGTRELLDRIKKRNVKIGKVVQASAIGIYSEENEISLEDSPKADGFLGNLCQDWEAEVVKSDYKYCILRFGMVLGKDDGAMKKMLPVFKLGLGGKLGDGDFMMSWIHVKDLTSLIIKSSIETNMEGVFNAVSQYPVSNKEFTQTLSFLLEKPAFFTVPKFLLKTILGEMSKVLLADLAVKSKKLKDVKFVFKYPTVETALKEVVSKAR